jgi:hypothetical protein
MMEFICDTCHTRKRVGENWILGFASETAGAQAGNREISVLPGWASARAVHPLAVHFCSERCKEKYMTWLFSYQIAS